MVWNWGLGTWWHKFEVFTIADIHEFAVSRSVKSAALLRQSLLYLIWRAVVFPFRLRHRHDEPSLRLLLNSDLLVAAVLGGRSTVDHRACRRIKLISEYEWSNSRLLKVVLEAALCVSLGQE